MQAYPSSARLQPPHMEAEQGQQPTPSAVASSSPPPAPLTILTHLVRPSSSHDSMPAMDGATELLSLSRCGPLIRAAPSPSASPMSAVIINAASCNSSPREIDDYEHASPSGEHMRSPQEVLLGIKHGGQPQPIPPSLPLTHAPLATNDPVAASSSSSSMPPPVVVASIHTYAPSHLAVATPNSALLGNGHSRMVHAALGAANLPSEHRALLSPVQRQAGAAGWGGSMASPTSPRAASNAANMPGQSSFAASVASRTVSPGGVPPPLPPRPLWLQEKIATTEEPMCRLLGPGPAAIAAAAATAAAASGAPLAPLLPAFPFYTSTQLVPSQPPSSSTSPAMPTPPSHTIVAMESYFSGPHSHGHGHGPGHTREHSASSSMSSSATTATATDDPTASPIRSPGSPFCMTSPTSTSAFHQGAATVPHSPLSTSICSTASAAASMECDGSTSAVCVRKASRERAMSTGSSAPGDVVGEHEAMSDSVSTCTLPAQELKASLLVALVEEAWPLAPKVASAMPSRMPSRSPGSGDDGFEFI